MPRSWPKKFFKRQRHGGRISDNPTVTQFQTKKNKLFEWSLPLAFRLQWEIFGHPIIHAFLERRISSYSPNAVTWKTCGYKLTGALCSLSNCCVRSKVPYKHLSVEILDLKHTHTGLCLWLVMSSPLKAHSHDTLHQCALNSRWIRIRGNANSMCIVRVQMSN